MPLTRQNLLAHEWIGLHVSVEDSPDPGLRTVSGLVVDETKNTLIIEFRGKRVMVPKSRSTLTASLPIGERSRVQGDLLRFRPEDRIKKRLNKW